jgi:WD40 repeat protein
MSAGNASSRRSLLGALLLGAACSGAPAQPSNASDAANSAPSAAASAAGGPQNPSASARAQTDVLDPQARQKPILDLPRVDAFLNAPLPTPRPERYRSFAQTSRILVGRSHLQEVDLFPGDELLLAMSDDEGSVRVYERASARLVGNYPVPGFKQFETGGVLAWPEGAPRFVAGSSQGLFLYDARTGSVLKTFASERLGTLRWSPDRRILVARGIAQQDSSVLHFYLRSADGPTGANLEPLGQFTFHERIDAWDLSADNRLLVLATYPSSDLVVVDLRTGVETLRIPGTDFGGDVAFSPDGRLVAMGGKGLLLVDLLNPARRAFRSHFYNNIGHVRFSPSGDAVVTSSYDGRLRIFRYETIARDARTSLTLSLQQTLRHDGQANVYAFVFEANGDGIVSASGDQTVRTFRAAKPAQSTAPATPTTRTFHSLADWARLDPEGARPFPPAPPPSMRDGHYHPPLLDGAPRPSRIVPGHYACKVDLMYKLRDCSVQKDAKGHTLLKFGPGNLLDLEGVLYDDGPVVRFEGWLLDRSLVGGCEGCEKQPLHAVLRGTGSRFQGLLKFRAYYDPYTPPELPAADEPIEAADDRFPLVLELRAPPEQPKR